MNGILELCERFGIDKGEITRVLHGTTTATNAILEQDGCTVGMICLLYTSDAADD